MDDRDKEKNIEKKKVMDYRRSDPMRDGSRTDPGRATLKLVRSKVTVSTGYKRRGRA
jgi:hypothetical protein